MRSGRVDVAIIAAGMSGIRMAVKLQDAGIDTFTIFEQAAEVGGTWRDNTYPGLTCDVPSRYYTYTFAPNPDWSRLTSPGAEIQSYFRRVTDERGSPARVASPSTRSGRTARTHTDRWRYPVSRICSC